MKKILLGLGILSVAALVSCGSSKDNKKAEITQLTDDTDLSAYTLTTGDAIYNSVNQVKIFNTVSVGFKYSVSLDNEKESAAGLYSYYYNRDFQKWTYDLANSQTNASVSRFDIESYNNAIWDGLYYEYTSYSAMMNSSCTTVNWYTKNSGGYRCVGLINEDDSTTRFTVDWNHYGYRESTTRLHYDNQTEGKLTTTDMKITYSYEQYL